MRFREDKFEKWENETTIPADVLGILNGVCKYIGIDEPYIDTIVLRNRGGHIFGYAKGFTLTHCTSSMEDGPSIDYSSALSKFIKGLGFHIENSYGDNGIDSATNWHDTFWSYDFIYKGSIISDEAFTEWEDDDYEL